MTDEELEFVKKTRNENGEEVFEYRITEEKPFEILKNKIVFWLLILSGIAIGTILFLFFLTFLIYFVIPVALIVFIWSAINRWKMR